MLYVKVDLEARKQESKWTGKARDESSKKVSILEENMEAKEMGPPQVACKYRSTEHSI